MIKEQSGTRWNCCPWSNLLGKDSQSKDQPSRTCDKGLAPGNDNLLSISQFFIPKRWKMCYQWFSRVIVWLLIYLCFVIFRSLKKKRRSRAKILSTGDWAHAVQSAVLAKQTGHSLLWYPFNFSSFCGLPGFLPNYLLRFLTSNIADRPSCSSGLSDF